VLSRSTQNYDRSEKFAAYRTINTFQEYVLIDQYRIRVEHHVKTAVNQWLFSEYDDPTVTISLRFADVQIQIADLYDNIDFT
jgi:Uma2 family endonuclease